MLFAVDTSKFAFPEDINWLDFAILEVGIDDKGKKLSYNNKVAKGADLSSQWESAILTPLSNAATTPRMFIIPSQDPQIPHSLVVFLPEGCSVSFRTLMSPLAKKLKTLGGADFDADCESRVSSDFSAWKDCFIHSVDDIKDFDAWKDISFCTVLCNAETNAAAMSNDELQRKKNDEEQEKRKKELSQGNKAGAVAIPGMQPKRDYSFPDVETALSKANFGPGVVDSVLLKFDLTTKDPKKELIATTLKDTGSCPKNKSIKDNNKIFSKLPDKTPWILILSDGNPRTKDRQLVLCVYKVGMPIPKLLEVPHIENYLCAYLSVLIGCNVGKRRLEKLDELGGITTKDFQKDKPEPLE